MVVIALLAGAFVGGSSMNAASAQAATPSVDTGSAQAIDMTRASVIGSVDPEGEDTMVGADYARANELWCTSGGKEGTRREAVLEDVGSGFGWNDEVSIEFNRLRSSSEYCVALVATNESGTSYGMQVRFTTPAESYLPGVYVNGAKAISATIARVEGGASTSGEDAKLYTDYAFASELWCTSAGKKGTPLQGEPEDLGGGFGEYSEMTLELKGLVPESEYCVEWVAADASGATHSQQVYFTTPKAQTGPPLIVTGEAQAIDTTKTTVTGRVDPEGEDTKLHADYADVNELWCVSGGKEGTPIETLSEDVGSGFGWDGEVSFELSGLSPNTEYCVALVTKNGSGTTYGKQIRLITSDGSGIPRVYINSAGAKSATIARVEGGAATFGEDTKLYMDYASASELWCTSAGKEGTPLQTELEDLGDGFIEYGEMILELKGLLPESEYCVDWVATDASGTTRSQQVRFTTLTALTAPPLVATGEAQASGATTATVTGRADPEGEDTMLHADYARASELWCTSEGKEGTPPETIPEDMGSGFGWESEASVELSDLAPETEYCVALIAVNESGTIDGKQVRFTTAAEVVPKVGISGADAISATAAWVDGGVESDGKGTEFYVDYALADEPWCVSGGKEGTPLQTEPQDLGSGFIADSEMLVELKGLTPGSEYCVDLSATDLAGASHTEQVHFTTSAAQTTPPPAGEPQPIAEPGPATDPGTPSIDPNSSPQNIPGSIIPGPAVGTPGKGAGVKPLTEAQKLQRALRACRRRLRWDRAICERRARARYREAAKKARRS
jgi:hypothetical protein